MPEGISAFTANGILNAVGNNTPFSVASPFVQLHTGAPGAAGTANVAGNATRKAVSFGAAAGGAIANDAAVAWSAGEVDTAEDYTHWSAWDAAAAGNFIGSGIVTANPVLVGDLFTFPVGAFTIQFPLAS